MLSKRFITLIIGWFIIMACSSCGFYGFKGISIPADINTYLVDDFRFTDAQCEAGIEQEFSEALRRKIRDGSRLVKSNDPDIIFEGTVSSCRTSYIAPTEGSTASLNRLEIAIKIEFTNTKDEEANYSRSYDAFQDYDSNADFQSLKGGLTETIIDDISERIFNDAFTNW